MRERYLEVLSAENWDKFTSVHADLAVNPWYRDQTKCQRKTYDLYWFCPVCIVFKHDCFDCMGRRLGCLEIPATEKIDRLIAKLESAGVFD